MRKQWYPPTGKLRKDWREYQLAWMCLACQIWRKTKRVGDLLQRRAIASLTEVIGNINTEDKGSVRLAIKKVIKRQSKEERVREFTWQKAKGEGNVAEYKEQLLALNTKIKPVGLCKRDQR